MLFFCFAHWGGRRRGGDEAEEASAPGEGCQLGAEELSLQVRPEDPSWQVGGEEVLCPELKGVSVPLRETQ